MLQNLSSDTKVVLLLSCAWGKSNGFPKPLSLTEYNKLANWLKEESLRPADLLSPEAQTRYRNSFVPPIEPDRVDALLQLGGVMAIQVERWLDSGVWVLSRADEEYPGRLKRVLSSSAPPILFGFGSTAMLSRGGIAIVGSRDVDEEGIQFTEALSRACARGKLTVISGGARGVDQTAMQATFDAGGTVIGALANDLTRVALRRDCRLAIQEERLVLFSPYHPDSGFSVGNAMGRNKLIYALADAAVVVSATAEKGGTWAGAVENLGKWKTPLFVRETEKPEGNMRLIRKGGELFPLAALEDPTCLLESIPTPEQVVSEPQARELPSAYSSEIAEQSKTETPLDLYELVLPYLLEFMRVPRTSKDIVRFLGVCSAQADDWLKRAVEDGKVEIKKKTPRLYLARISLFE